MRQALPVDTEAAQELLKEATKLISTNALDELVHDLERKSERFKALLSPEALPQLSEAHLDELAGMMFTVRSKRRRLVAGKSIEQHRAAIHDLLYSDRPLSTRFEDFADLYAFLDTRPHRTRVLTSELLHFTSPERYWLWTPWIWEPASGKGVLRMITAPEVPLNGTSNFDIYQKVGAATAMVSMDGKSSGYTRAGRGLLGTDVFLATVSALTMFTLYKHRISQEFLRFLPEFLETVRRLLGVHHLAEVA